MTVHRCPYCTIATYHTVDGLEAHAEECGEEEVTCPMCSGRKTQHLHGASFTMEEMDELGPEFSEDYTAGLYEHPCDHCQGSGKTTRAVWSWHLESEAERRMGA